ncbi:MAG TPA: polysaccharide biosynthesis tyrosine autokinase [Actinopolymorphaceae bacterium]
MDVNDRHLFQRKTGTTAVDIRDYAKVLRRRWLLILLTTVVTVGVAAALTMRMTPQYAAKVRIFVSTTRTGAAELYQGGLFAEQRVQSYANLIDGPELASRVIDRLDLETEPGELTNRIQATVVPKTVILEVRATDPNPAQALRLVDALGKEFVRLVAELETAKDADGAAIKASILGSPSASDRPVSPRLTFNLGLAAMLGLLLGLGLAALREAVDTSLRDADELAELTGAPALGHIPADPDATSKPTLNVVEPHAPRAEAFRIMSTNLQFVEVDKPSKVLVVTSSVPGEGKTVSACNLAITMAKSGQRVALVECDLRRPRIGHYLGLESAVGLTTVLIGRATLSAAMQPFGRDALPVLTGGAMPPQPADLLQSQAFADVLGELRHTFDTVILDAPPLLPVTDAALLAARADGALLVVRYGKTTREQVRTAVERLTSVKGRLIGTVFNRIPLREGKPYYGYSSAKPYGQRRAEREKLVLPPDHVGAALTKLAGTGSHRSNHT